MSLYAYEIDCFGGGTTWEVYENFVDAPAIVVESQDFGDFLDTSRKLGYPVYINTYESWEAME